MGKIKKIFLSILIVLFTGGFIFLSTYDNGLVERMEIPVNLNDVKSDEQKSNSELIIQLDKNEKKKKQQEALEKDRSKQNDSKILDFDGLFNASENTAESDQVMKPIELSKKISESAVITTEKEDQDPFGRSFGNVEKEASTQQQGSFSNSGKEITYVNASLLDGFNDVQKGSRVEFRLLEPLEINNKLIAKNTVFDAFVVSIGERVRFRVTLIGGVRASFTIYDTDYEEGVYVGPEGIAGTIYEDVSEDVEDDLIGRTGVRTVDIVKGLAGAITAINFNYSAFPGLYQMLEERASCS